MNELQEAFDFHSSDEAADEDDELTLGLNDGGNIVLWSTDWTSETIVRQLKKGNIELDPVFQRRDAWRPDRKSKFIESLILGLPIPQIVLAESLEHKGRFVVIDGKQRLLTLRQFTADNNEEFAQLKLHGLKVLKELNGETYTSLQHDGKFEITSAFENSATRTVIIKNWKDEKVLYEIFLRLNTGSLPLSSQELRQAIRPGPFTKFVAQFSADSGSIRSLFGDGADFRMRDVELMLRYLSFRNFSRSYKGSLKTFLDNAMNHLNVNWNSEEVNIKACSVDLEKTIDACVAVFGKTGAFRKWSGDKFERGINRAVFDVFAMYLADPKIREEFLRHQIAVVSGFKAICDEPRFRVSVEGTTKTIEAFNTRLEIGARMLSSALDIEVKPVSVGGR